MIFMNKTTLLTIAAVVLFLLNIGVISFLIMNKPPRPGEEGPKRIIIERLRFNTEQADRYEDLIEQHKREIGPINDEIAATKNQLYKTLPSPDPVKEDSLTALIGRLQERMEHIHYRHFLAIKQLCRADQRNDFDALTNDLSEYFSPKERRPK
jgi:protein CpxP